MLTLLAAVGVAVAAAACPPLGPQDPQAPFAVQAAAPGTVVLELRLAEATDPAAALSLLAVLTDRGLPGTVLVDPRAAAAHSEVLDAARSGGHEVGLLLPFDSTSNTAQAGMLAFEAWWGRIRRGKKAIRKAGGGNPVSVALAPASIEAEVAAEQSGMRAVLSLDPGRKELSRRVKLGDEPGRARFLTPGPYGDACGALLPSWTPRAFDRASRAPAGQPGRIALPVAGADPALLARWLDTVLDGSEVRVVAARRATLLPARQAVVAPPPPPGRPVDADMWAEAAERLSKGGRLPRVLPGSLNLTEAFVALATVAASESPPQTVRLGPVGPPADVARSTLPPEGTTLSEDAVRSAARDLAPALQRAVPAFVAVGPQSLTAAEFLVVLARLERGQPLIAVPATSPDPYAPGAGWGRSP